MTLKRPLQDDNSNENMTMANCLMLLYGVGKSGSDDVSSEPDKVFHCKTCNKLFRSFQALGGHCASHKRPKLNDLASQSPPKAKTHECNVCGQEFAIGQALGGHMRRHRDDVNGKTVKMAVKKESGTKGLFLDLNLTPFENVLMLKMWPTVT